MKDFKNKLISIILSVVLFIQPLVVYASDTNNTEDEPLSVVSVQSVNGERNKLRVTFSRPSKIDVEDLEFFVTQNSEYSSNEKICSPSCEINNLPLA